MSFRSWLKDKTGFDYKDGTDYLTAPVAGLYVLGAGINDLTGGDVATYNPFRANDPGGNVGTTYSRTTQWISGNNQDVPGGEGGWNIPLINLNFLKDPDGDWDVPNPVKDAGRWVLAAALLGGALLVSRR